MSEQRRILVVDDQQEIRELTATVLSGAGFRTETSGSGSDALRRLADEPYDLVLLDINMPEMDGWETLRLLRADEQLSAVQVVMFSVKGEVSDKVHSLQEGASGYITKPFIIDELIAGVERVLESDPRAAGSRE
jgi:DNA-binding response OmpR family regulator